MQTNKKVDILMNIEVFDEINQYLKNKKYKKIPTDSDKVKMYAVYQKSSLYLFNIIYLTEEYTFDKERYVEYRNITKNQFDKVSADNVVLLNVIVTQSPYKLYEFLNYTPELDEKFIDIHWIVDINNRDLIIPNKQISSVLGLEKDFKKILKEGTSTYYDLKRQYNSASVSYLIVLVNFIFWFLLEMKGGSTNSQVLLKYGALHLSYVTGGEYWRILSSMFMHIGLTHLAFNSFSILIFGSRLERYLRSWQFGIIYLVSGIFGALFSLGGSALVNGNILSAGASGAIYGLIGSILICSRAMGRPLEGLTSYSMWLIFIIGIIYSITSPNVDAFAHIGGFIGGIIITIPFVNSYKKESKIKLEQ
jgi:membrane associated rhomboid family serine protease